MLPASYNFGYVGPVASTTLEGFLGDRDQLTFILSYLLNRGKQMNKPEYDVVITGTGMGGSASGAVLARQG